MNFFRKAKGAENPYVMMPKAILGDTSLSWKAKGLLAYLLSRPDDWQVWEKDLVARSRDSRDSVRSAVKELIQAGYILRERIQGEKGRFEGYEYTVMEEPYFNQSLVSDGLSVAGKSVHGGNPRHCSAFSRDMLRTHEQAKACGV